MGKIADELNERSKFDDKMIVGSEIRAAITELEAERDAFKRQKNKAREMVLLLCDKTQWPRQQKKFNLSYVIDRIKPITEVLSFQR